MQRPSIEPIGAADLPEFAAFLHRNLNPAFSARAWEAAFRKQWTPNPPNYGFLLRGQGRIVGAIGAFYADRPIRGRTERFCNITSWCVLDDYRRLSMKLAMAMISQEGFHFTDFSPTRVVAETLRFLKFKPLDDQQAVVFNLPGGFLGGGRVLDQDGELRANLDGEDLAAYRDHAEFPWLRHLAVGEGAEWCYLVYKRARYKGLPSANIVHLSKPALFERHLGRLRAYFLMRGMATTQVECRRLSKPPWPSKLRSGFNPKLFLSPTLGSGDIEYLYSESVALDL
jgi:hypothetical protein